MKFLLLLVLSPNVYAISNQVSYFDDYGRVIRSQGYAESCMRWDPLCFNVDFHARKQTQMNAHAICRELGYAGAEIKDIDDISCEFGSLPGRPIMSYTRCLDYFECLD